MIFESKTRARLKAEGPPARDVCMHRGMHNAFDRQEFWAERLTFMVCLKHVNEAEGLFRALLVAAQVTPNAGHSSSPHFLLGLFWASAPRSSSVHGHIVACCVCMRAAGVFPVNHLRVNVSVVRMVFPSGFLGGSTISSAILQLPRLPPQEAEPSHVPFRPSLLQKHRRPFPLSITHPRECRSAADEK